MKLAFEVQVNNPDGTEFSWDGSRRPNLDATALGYFTQKLQHLHTHATKLAGKGEDSANLSATFTMDVDGQVKTDTVSGISYAALGHFQAEVLNVLSDLVNIGKQRAKHKK